MKTKKLMELCAGSEQAEMDLLAASCRMSVAVALDKDSAEDAEEVIVLDEE